MIQSHKFEQEEFEKEEEKKPGSEKERLAKLVSMGRISINLINELASPIDSINRFINLALQTAGEGSQSRQFLLQSKEGVHQTSLLLQQINSYAKRIEQELQEISRYGNQESPDSERRQADKEISL